jgi:hypothetical protein
MAADLVANKNEVFAGTTKPTENIVICGGTFYVALNLQNLYISH